jgi:hypothetical protein
MRERSDADTLTREKQHHDRWAYELKIDQIMVKRSFEASTAPENRFILRKMGKIENKRLLRLNAVLVKVASTSLSKVPVALPRTTLPACSIKPSFLQESIKLP